MMPLLNVRCNNKKCGHVFPSGMNISNMKNASFAGNSGRPCPRCGGPTSLIANGTTIDIIGDQITVKRGWLSLEDLAVIATSLERFQATQDNRAEVEAQIASTFPQIQNKVQRLSSERLLLLVGMLLALMTVWQSSPPSMDAAEQQIEHAIQTVQGMGEETLADAFEAYEAHKQSAHALRTKILRFFPKLETFIRGMSYSDLVITIALAIAALDRWKPRGKLKDFKANDEQTAELLAELIAEIKGARADFKAAQSGDDSKGT